MDSKIDIKLIGIILCIIIIAFIVLLSVVMGNGCTSPVVKSDSYNMSKTSDESENENRDEEDTEDVAEGVVSEITVSEDYETESENSTEEDSEEEITPSSDWAKKYYNKIKEMEEDYVYDLIDVNGDDIPEIACYGQEYGFYSVITYGNDSIDILDVSDAFFDYVEGKNYAELYDSTNEYYSRIIYSIEDGKWVKIAIEEAFKIKEYTYEYYWNGELTEKPDFGSINPYYDSSELKLYLAGERNKLSLRELKKILYGENIIPTSDRAKPE